MAVAVLAATGSTYGQGSLTPEGDPAPSMKSLQEIWDKLCEIDSRLGAMEEAADDNDTSDGVATLSDSVINLADALGIGLTYSWSIDQVDGVGQDADDVGTHTSLAFDPDDNPCISYHNKTDEDLKFAEYNGSRWDRQTIDSSGDTGKYTSLAFSEDGNAAISYFDDSANSLNFAWRATPGSVFLSYTARSPSDGEIFGYYSDLAFHPVNGRPYIAHRNQDDLTLELAILNHDVTNIPGEFNADDWTHSNLPWASTDGLDVSLAFLDTGDYWLSFGRSSGLDLRATHVYSGASFMGVDTGSDQVGTYTSIAINSSSKPSIAYYDQSTGDLKFAEYSSGWSTTVVDSADSVGQYCSHAYSPSGKPGIAYYDSTNKALKYAERVNGAWKTYTVDTGGEVGTYCSLAFTKRGRPAISYYDSENGTLKYAEAQNTVYTHLGLPGGS